MPALRCCDDVNIGSSRRFLLLVISVSLLTSQHGTWAFLVRTPLRTACRHQQVQSHSGLMHMSSSNDKEKVEKGTTLVVDEPNHESLIRDYGTNNDAFVQRPFESQALNKEDLLPSPGDSFDESQAPSSSSQKVHANTAAVTPTFPISSIVSHQEIRHALRLAAANPRLGAAGVLLQGGRGTCKSVLARSVQQLVKNKSNTQREAQLIHVPLQVLEDSLLGSVDLEQSLASGKAAFAPGILTKAHDQVLILDDFHLMEEPVAALLLQALADGQVNVEREGLSVTYPCRPRLVVATANPNEAELREAWIDRFAMTLWTDGEPLTVKQRVQVTLNVEDYYDRRDRKSSVNEEATGAEMIETVRQLLPQVTIATDQILYLCQEATRAQCEGQRAELFATEIAKTCAALDGRTRVNSQDLQHAVLLAIATRAQVSLLIEDDTSSGDQDSQPRSSQDLQPLEPEPDIMPPPGDSHQEEHDSEQEEDDTTMEDKNKNEHEEEDEEEEEEVVEIPQEFMFGIDMTASINPKLLQFRKKVTRKGKGGKRTKIFSTHRGRYVKAIYPKAGDYQRGRLALGATLRAAAPHQRWRRNLQKQILTPDRGVSQNQTDVHNNHIMETIRRRRQRQTKTPLVYITKEDFRIQRMSRKAGTLVVFVVDASGSMALNRMGAAKGAAMTLLKEAYKSRDKIALVVFHGPQAHVVVPPTKSMSMTRQRLESLPCGGGSPLAHALEVAMRTGLNEVKVKKDVGRVILVLLTDGRANVPLDVSHGEVAAAPGGISSDRKLLREEVVGVAKQLAILDNFDLLCIDTEDYFVGTGIAQEVTRVALGNYHHLSGTTDSATVTNIVQQGIQNAKT